MVFKDVLAYPDAVFYWHWVHANIPFTFTTRQRLSKALHHSAKSQALSAQTAAQRPWVSTLESADEAYLQFPPQEKRAGQASHV